MENTYQLLYSVHLKDAVKYFSISSPLVMVYSVLHESGYNGGFHRALAMLEECSDFVSWKTCGRLKPIFE